MIYCGMEIDYKLRDRGKCDRGMRMVFVDN